MNPASATPEGRPSPAPPCGHETFRDIPVDILRGLAIALMVMANLAPALLLQPAPGWFRVLSSLAAPLFITTAGMMVALSYAVKERPLKHIAVRGGLTILCAALIQVLVNGRIPFIDMDVLYLIGLSLPVTWIFLGLPQRQRRMAIAAILLVTPLLWVVPGYTESVPSPGFTISSMGIQTEVIPPIGEIAKRWLVDGWFPLFPWLALALFGAETGMYRWGSGRVRRFSAAAEGRYASALLVGGGILWLLYPGARVVRYGYVELFYPPVPGLLLFAAGFLLLAFILLDQREGWYAGLDPLRAAGECSLFLYILHLAIIAWFIAPQGLRLPVWEYLPVYLVFLAVLAGIAYVLRSLRKSRFSRLFPVRFLIGG